MDESWCNDKMMHWLVETSTPARLLFRPLLREWSMKPSTGRPETERRYPIAVCESLCDSDSALNADLLLCLVGAGVCVLLCWCGVAFKSRVVHCGRLHDCHTATTIQRLLTAPSMRPTKCQASLCISCPSQYHQLSATVTALSFRSPPSHKTSLRLSQRSSRFPSAVTCSMSESKTDDDTKSVFSSSSSSSASLASSSTNSRGIPVATFIEDVPSYLSLHHTSPDALLRSLQSLYGKYKFMESQLVSQQKQLLTKLPDIQNALTSVQYLIAHPSTALSLQFELADSVYASAVVEAGQRTVLLWLGANVMLEYEVAEACELLTRNKKNAEDNLAGLDRDLAFLKDQITVSEVNIARVHNVNVAIKQSKKREDEAAAAAGGGSGGGGRSQAITA